MSMRIPDYCEQAGPECPGCDAIIVNEVQVAIRSAEVLPAGVEIMTAEELADGARAIMEAEFPTSRLYRPEGQLTCDDRRRAAAENARQVVRSWLGRSLRPTPPRNFVS